MQQIIFNVMHLDKYAGCGKKKTRQSCLQKLSIRNDLTDENKIKKKQPIYIAVNLFNQIVRFFTRLFYTSFRTSSDTDQMIRRNIKDHVANGKQQRPIDRRIDWRPDSKRKILIEVSNRRSSDESQCPQSISKTNNRARV